MHLLAPDILTEAQGLSVAVTATGIFVGLMLWLTGWNWHRFWIVLATTVVAGFFGLLSSPVHRMQPLVAGLLLAVAAGVLALALVRVVAFVAGGIALWLAVRALAPAGWDLPLVCFMGGGLAGLYFFRFWIRLLTSFAGTLLMGYSGLCLADRLHKVDAVALATKRAVVLNGVCCALAFAGVSVQVLIERRRARKNQKKEEEIKRKMEEAKIREAYARQKKRWWPLSKFRKAG